MAHLQIRVAVADNPGSGNIQCVLAGRAFEQAWIGLAALAGIFRFMWAKINSVDARAAGSKFRNHFLVDFVNERFRKYIARYSGLICHHDDGYARIIQSADRGGRERENLQAVHMIDVAHLFANRAVAVKESGPSKRACLRHSGCSSVGNCYRSFEFVAPRKRHCPR